MPAAKDVTIGSVRMSQQAALIVVPVLAVAMLALFRDPSRVVLVGAVMFVAAGLFEAYSVQCMLSGGCDKFAWLNALLFAFPVILLGVALFDGKFKEHRDSDDEF